MHVVSEAELTRARPMHQLLSTKALISHYSCLPYLLHEATQVVTRTRSCFPGLLAVTPVARAD
jgi:hypothetical protein